MGEWSRTESAHTFRKSILVATYLAMLLLTSSEPMLEADVSRSTYGAAYQSECTYLTEPEHLQGYINGISSSPSTRQTRQTSGVSVNQDLFGYLYDEKRPTIFLIWHSRHLEAGGRS